MLRNEIVPLHGHTCTERRPDFPALITTDFGKSSEQLKFVLEDPTIQRMLPNGWLTELRDQEERVLFCGLRSGTLSHYGDPSTPLRQRGARKMGEQLITQLLAFTCARLVDSTIVILCGKGEVIDLPVLSIDLQTRYPEIELTNPKTIEQRVVDEQRQMLESLEGLHTFAIASGLSITARIEPILFNFPTTGTSIRTGVGYDDVTLERNAQAMGRLLSRVEASLKGEANPVIEYLAREVKAMWEAGSYITPESDPYRIVSHVLLLSHHLGIVPHFNCRSGKDRTAMADAEVKLLAARIQALQGNLSHQLPGELGSEESRLLFELAAGIPNSEVQRLNTGVPGSKLKPAFPERGEEDPLVRRIGAQRWNAFKGFADLLGVDD